MTERYPDEGRALRLFLEQLAPIAEMRLGQDSLLRHMIRKALASQSLGDLRRARSMFNLLPRELKQELSEGFVDRKAAADQPVRQPYLRAERRSGPRPLATTARPRRDPVPRPR